MHPTTNLLIVHYGDDWIRGSEACLLNLLDTLSCHFRPIVWTNNHALKQKLDERNISNYQSVFTLIDAQQSHYDLRAWNALRQQASHLITQHNIGLIHVNSGAPCQWMSLVSRAKKIPMLCQLHSPYNLHDRFILGLHGAPHLIAVSHAVAKPLLDEDYPKQNLTVIHNGVPNITQSPSFNVRESLAIPTNAKVLISVGSLIKRKGFDKLIQALALLNNKQPSHHLVIIGEGSERLNLIAQIKHLNLTDQVHLVGEQSNVSQWLSGGCDLFVSGARSEAFGLVLVEASLSGLAVIAPDVGGISEVIEDQINGFLYQNGANEVQAISDAVIQLLDNPDLRLNMAINGEKIAKQRFSLDRNTQQIETVYRKLINTQQRHSWFAWAAWFTSLLRPTATLVKTRLFAPIKNIGGHYEG